MKSSLAFCLMAVLVFVAVETQGEECKPDRPFATGQNCTENQCCVKRMMFAQCKDIPGEGEKCGGLGDCDCQEGLSCVSCKCQRSDETTTPTTAN